jgi:ABC-type multidrug transport system ATPase subunit
VIWVHEPPLSGDTGEAAILGSCLTKRFHRQSTPALLDVNIAISRGEVRGLFGANGAGKTTLIKCLCGLLTPDAGTARLDGRDVYRERGSRNCAVLLEGTRQVYWRLTVRENVEFFAGLKGRRRADVRRHMSQILDLVRLTAKRDHEARLLSRGMQQRLGLACALAQDTPTLILDEPSLGLDAASTAELVSALRDVAEGTEKAILLSSHDRSVLASTCGSVTHLENGAIRTTVVKHPTDTTLYRFLLGHGQEAFDFSTTPELSRLLVREESGGSLQFAVRDGELQSLLSQIYARTRRPITAIERVAPEEVLRMALES